MLVEICCDGLEAARVAVGAGADRIELCSDLSCGGLTPPHDILEEAVSLGVPVNVLIRPREGNFVYSDSEIHHLFFNIAYCGNSHVNGVVIGALTDDSKIDVPLCKDMVDMARSYSMEVTFHRAIDCTSNILEATEEVLCLGVDRILTSGGAASAPEGVATIKKMMGMAQGRAIIMPGCGITADNVASLIRKTHPKEIHGSRIDIIKKVK